MTVQKRQLGRESHQHQQRLDTIYVLRALSWHYILVAQYKERLANYMHILMFAPQVHGLDSKYYNAGQR